LADSITLDPINNVVRVQGRDYSSVLINSTYQHAFCNQTSSEIANFIAERHGFDSVITETSPMAGSYQCDGYNQVLLNAHSRITTEWGLLAYLAKVEGFQLFIDGRTLMFCPLSSIQQNHITVDKSNATAIRFYKTCPLSTLTTLMVKSWNSWLSEPILQTREQSSTQVVPGTLSVNDTSGAEIAIVRPNLSPRDAEQIAQRYQDEFNDQTLNVAIVMPGEHNL
jgi:hypothetical protein